MTSRKTTATGNVPRKRAAAKKKNTAAKGIAAKARGIGSPRVLGSTAAGIARTPTARKTADHRLPEVAFRAQAVIDAVGSTTVTAELLAVSKSQPSRWSRGEERPGPAKARLLLDVDYVYSRAQLIWGRDAVNAWMLGSNMLLDGARPIDIVRERGPAEVIAALDTEASGAFA